MADDAANEREMWEWTAPNVEPVWSWEKAQHLFLSRFRELGGR